jgi:ribosomal protein S18 acetylase RimI-like enzyme
MSEVEVHPVRVIDLPAIAELHRSVLECSLNSHLGLRHLAFVYDFARRDADSVVLGAYLHDAVVGVVSATLDTGRLQRQMVSSMSARQWVGLVSRVSLHPHLLFEIMGEKARFGQPTMYDGKAVISCLTAIAVHPQYTRMGIGKALVALVDEFFRSRSCSAYRLDTRADNVVASKFYLRLGFVQVEQRGPDVIWIKELARNHPVIRQVSQRS